MPEPIPDKLINFKVFLGGNDLLGLADVDLPSIEMMTETVTGAGIAGELETPVIGHTTPITLSLSWRTVTKSFARLAAPEPHQLDLRGAMQFLAAEVMVTVPVRVTVITVPKKAELGKMATGKAMETQSELAVSYLKMWVDGEEKIEIDKLNYIYIVDGVDYLAPVRTALGMG